MDRRHFLTTALTCFAAPQALACGKLETVRFFGSAAKLVNAARKQIGETTLYDPAYVRLDYPNGDVPRQRGVCTDVVIRAYRDAFGIDLQKLVHDDMVAHFNAYPDIWGLSKPDRNIDHRRVPNLETFFTRHGKSLPISDHATDYVLGDLVTMTLSGRLPHIGVVSGAVVAPDSRPFLIHNIGGGTQEEDILFQFPINGHYRFALD
jgi:uncharacterized protein